MAKGRKSGLSRKAETTRLSNVGGAGRSRISAASVRTSTCLPALQAHREEELQRVSSAVAGTLPLCLIATAADHCSTALSHSDREAILDMQNLEPLPMFCDEDVTGGDE